jgi:hypothetical protein
MKIDPVYRLDLYERLGFSIVGDASAMIAKHFDFRTVSTSGEIERLRPLADPSKFGIEIPLDYSGQNVPLWRFVLHPSSPGTLAEVNR